jgi:hypothetical protein
MVVVNTQCRWPTAAKIYAKRAKLASIAITETGESPSGATQGVESGASGFMPKRSRLALV